MGFVDLIEKKKRGGALRQREIADAVRGYVDGVVPDYQMAALLMAVRWRGLDVDETVALTEAMIDSGERWRFDDLGRAVDKHSTGGVGDKISLILAPLAAACGCLVPMVSGRGLGHTGGTLDKLESIPGFRTDLGRETFRRQLEKLGVAMGAQTEDLVPADRLLYALRDVTATVDEPGLITASILSKKIAEGADGLVLDLKVGSGAFCRDLAAADILTERLLEVGGRCGLRIVTQLSDMEAPLGRTVGNALEVEESIETLRGEGPSSVTELTVALTGEMVRLAGLADDIDGGRERARTKLASGAALECFERLVAAQGGDPRICREPTRLPRAAERTMLRAPRSGWVVALDALLVGRAALALGAGRATKESSIDPGAGIRLHVHRGAPVEAGEPWATVEYGAAADLDRARSLLERAITVGDEPPPSPPLLLERRA